MAHSNPPLPRDGRRVLELKRYLGDSPLPQSDEFCTQKIKSYNISKIVKEIQEKREKNWKKRHPFKRPLGE
jgi:hypothetical protein